MEKSEGFTSKNEDGREADFRLANRDARAPQISFRRPAAYLCKRLAISGWWRGPAREMREAGRPSILDDRGDVLALPARSSTSYPRYDAWPRITRIQEVEVQTCPCPLGLLAVGG